MRATGAASIPAVTTRVCTACQKELPFSAFYKRKTGKYGLRSQCKKCERERHREWQSGNEKRKTYMKSYLAQYYQDNKEKHQEYGRAYYQKNRVKKLAYASQWAKDNPEKFREVERRRRAQKLNAGVGPIPHRDELLRRQGGMCAYCKRKDGKFHIDHIMPLKLGGSHTEDNVQMLCENCNRRKSAKHPLRFAREQGRLL